MICFYLQSTLVTAHGIVQRYFFTQVGLQMHVILCLLDSMPAEIECACITVIQHCLCVPFCPALSNLHFMLLYMNQLCAHRSGKKEYLEIAQGLSRLWHDTKSVSPVGLLDCLKVGSNLKGFFKALTPPAPSKAWYQRQAPLPNEAPLMVGCHITVQGKGVQWLQAQVILINIMPVLQP